MHVGLSSGKYDIIASGEAFLFDPFGDLNIEIYEDAEILLRIVLKFEDDASAEHDIRTDVTDDALLITCVNFNGIADGLKKPAHIAVVNGKEVYFMFASGCHGDKDGKSRSVKYTVFMEK